MTNAQSKKLLRHLILASNRVSGKKEKKTNFSSQIEDIRRKLEKREESSDVLSSKLDKFSSLLDDYFKRRSDRSDKTSDSTNQKLQLALDKIDDLNRRISEITLKDHGEKIHETNQLLDSVNKRLLKGLKTEDFKLIEKGLNFIKTDKNAEEIREIEDQLEFLEREYAKLLGSGDHSEEDLKGIKEKINNSKSKLKEKKN